MGVREAIEKHQKAAGAVGVILVLIAVSVSAYSLWPHSQQPLTKAYYTDDDGQSWFVDSIDKVPPFDHNGKTAVRVNLYTCDDSKTVFAGYLERCTPAAKKKLESEFNSAISAGKPISSVSIGPDISTFGTEIKKPGDKTWILRGHYPDSYKVMDVQCPNGGTVDSVFP
ncbi:MAG TPA: hypothetical protein VKK61_10230 [Tepidisphaeraceae bacterium]|nr:hypothetical protein [Tepidisphaeraceae bacterium]